MLFLMSTAPYEEKSKALLEADGTLLDYSFLLMLKQSPENIDDQIIIAAQAKISLEINQYQGIIAISLIKLGACVGMNFQRMI
jgi:hypothetical protein